MLITFELRCICWNLNEISISVNSFIRVFLRNNREVGKCHSEKKNPTQDFGLCPILAELIFHPEAWDGGRGWCPGNNKAVRCDFCHWLRSVHQCWKLRCLPFRCLHWRQRGVGDTFFSLNLCRGEAFWECYHSSLLTRTMGSGEIEARDLAASVGKHADQLTLVGDSWTQPTDRVGVHVTRNCNLCPGRAWIFLQDLVRR